MAKQYVIRQRNNDGTWTIDLDTTYSKKEAIGLIKFGLIYSGIVSQLWPLEEAKVVFGQKEVK